MRPRADDEALNRSLAEFRAAAILLEHNRMQCALREARLAQRKMAWRKREARDLMVAGACTGFGAGGLLGWVFSGHFFPWNLLAAVLVVVATRIAGHFPGRTPFGEPSPRSGPAAGVSRPGRARVASVPSNSV